VGTANRRFFTPESERVDRSLVDRRFPFPIDLP
jgi:hypothetical protein